jgi:hypothetical protein
MLIAGNYGASILVEVGSTGGFGCGMLGNDWYGGGIRFPGYFHGFRIV